MLGGGRDTGFIAIQAEHNFRRVESGEGVFQVRVQAAGAIQASHIANSRLPQRKGVQNRLRHPDPRRLLERLPLQHAALEARQKQMADLILANLAAVKAHHAFIWMIERHDNTALEMLAALGVQQSNLLQTVKSRAIAGNRVGHRAITEANPEGRPQLLRVQPAILQVLLSLRALLEALVVSIRDPIQETRDRKRRWLWAGRLRVGQLLGQLEHPGFDLRELQLLF